MSKKLDSSKISEIIQSATNEIITSTEDFIGSLDENPTGPNTISIMVNGVKTTLSQDDYNLLKSKNNKIKQKMKADIKVLTSEFKASFN